MSKGNTLVVCFSTSSYDAPIWTNKQHLMTLLSDKPGYFVLYIDQGMSTFYLRKAIRDRNWKYFIFPLKKIKTNLYTVAPYFLPLLMGGMLKKMAWSFLFYAFKVCCLLMKPGKIIFWVYQPQAWYFVKNVKNRANETIIYDCVDEFETQPFYSTNEKRRLELVDIERKLCKRANVVTTTSQGLYEDKCKFNRNTHCIHNVGDFNHFRFKSGIDESPPDWPIDDRVNVVYAGVIDGYKTDLDLIYQAASYLKNTHYFVFVGPVRISNRSKENKIRSLDNINFLGARPYSEVPRYLHQADLLWLPYTFSSHTNRVFPLKLFEYMSTGKPIVASRLLSFKAFWENIYSFDGLQDLVRLLMQVKKMDTEEKAEQRIRIAKKNTWESRLDKILREIEAVFVRQLK